VRKVRDLRDVLDRCRTSSPLPESAAERATIVVREEEIRTVRKDGDSYVVKVSSQANVLLTSRSQ